MIKCYHEIMVRVEHQSARMSEIKNGRLSMYGKV